MKRLKGLKSPPPSEVYSEDEVQNYLKNAGIKINQLEIFNKDAFDIAGKIIKKFIK